MKAKYRLFIYSLSLFIIDLCMMNIITIAHGLFIRDFDFFNSLIFGWYLSFWRVFLGQGFTQVVLVIASIVFFKKMSLLNLLAIVVLTFIITASLTISNLTDSVLLLSLSSDIKILSEGFIIILSSIAAYFLIEYFWKNWN